MKNRTLIARQRYFGVDAVQLRTGAGRVLTRVIGLPAARARVRADHVRQDFGVDTAEGETLVAELVDGGLLRPLADASGDFEVTDRIREFAAARVVEPLPRARARHLVGRACDIVRWINAEWTRNPLVVDALSVSGSYMSRDAALTDLVLGVVVRSRGAERRARWGRMANKHAGAQAIRAELSALSSFVVVHFATDTADLARPFAIVFRDEES